MPPNNPYPAMSGPQAMPPQFGPKKGASHLLVPFIISLVLLVTAIVFGVMTYTSQQDYKNNSDKKSAAAVKVAEAAQKAKLEAAFAEQEKSPLKTYIGPSTLGSVAIKYPKTWSAYVSDSSKSATPLDGYMHPDVVPGVTTSTAYALRFQVSNTAYDQEAKKFASLTTSGKVTVTPLAAVNVANVTGIKVTGEIETGKRGTVVLFPLRDKTLKLTTESETFNADFNNIILANLSFVP